MQTEVIVTCSRIGKNSTGQNTVQLLVCSSCDDRQGSGNTIGFIGCEVESGQAPDETAWHFLEEEAGLSALKLTLVSRTLVTPNSGERPSFQRIVFLCHRWRTLPGKSADQFPNPRFRWFDVDRLQYSLSPKGAKILQRTLRTLSKVDCDACMLLVWWPNDKLWNPIPGI